MMPNEILTMLPQIKANPLGFLIQRRFNVPQNIGTDPGAILQHLAQTGQVTHEQINRAYQTAQQLRR